MNSIEYSVRCGSPDQEFWTHLEKLRRIQLVFNKREVNDCASTSVSINYQPNESSVHPASAANPTNPSKDLLKKIENVFEDCLKSAAESGTSTIAIPKRKEWQNINFQKDIGIKMSENPSFSKLKESGESSRRFALTLHILKKIYDLIKSNRSCTKRELFYEDVALFKNQRIVDSIIDDISCLLNISKNQLHVLTTSKGCIAGSITFKDAEGNYIECNKTSQGILLPNDIEKISYIQSDARFVLIVEKSAAFQMLLDTNVTEILHPCILITGKGYPDANTRQMVRKLYDCLKIPILGLVDADPYGIEILSTYKYGSMAMSFDVKNLAVPEICWLGILPSDIQRLNLPISATLPLANSDVKKAKSLLTRPQMKYSPLWMEQIQTMLDYNIKAEIEGLTKINPTFLTSTYLPNKIKFGGWIR